MKEDFPPEIFSPENMYKEQWDILESIQLLRDRKDPVAVRKKYWDSGMRKYVKHWQMLLCVYGIVSCIAGGWFAAYITNTHYDNGIVLILCMMSAVCAILFGCGLFGYAICIFPSTWRAAEMYLCHHKYIHVSHSAFMAYLTHMAVLHRNDRGATFPPMPKPKPKKWTTHKKPQRRKVRFRKF